MSRREIRLTGYRWAPFDEELARFVRALRGGHDALDLPEDGRITLHLNPGTFAIALVPARVEVPERFLVTLLIECALNGAATGTGAMGERYSRMVRPYVVVDTGPPNLDGFGQFLHDVFRGEPPSARALRQATRQLALAWASRCATLTEPGFAAHVLERLSHRGGPENPMREGFADALSELEQLQQERQRH